MIKKQALKLYRKAVKFENRYGSKMTDKMFLGRLGYKIFTRQLILIYSKLYRISKKNRILMESSPDFSGNVKCFYDYMLDHNWNRKYKITWIVDDPKLYENDKVKNVRFLRRYDPHTGYYPAKNYKALWKSRYVFSMSRLNWGRTKSKHQIYFNLLNNIGLQKKNWNEEKESNIDYYMMPSEFYRESASELFQCEKTQILTTGGVRHYQFTRNRKEAEDYFCQLTKESKDSKHILWIPFQRSGHVLVKYTTGTASMMGVPLIQSLADLPRLNEICSNRKVHLIIYCNSNCGCLYKEAGSYSHITLITLEECKKQKTDIYELMPKFDALLSDYGSAPLDYLLLDKPIGYVLEDYEDFSFANGFIVEDPLSYMPGEKIYTMEDLDIFFSHVNKGDDSYRQQRMEVAKKVHDISEDNCNRFFQQFGIHQGG